MSELDFVPFIELERAVLTGEIVHVADPGCGVRIK